MESFLNPEDVEKIQVTNYNYDAQREAAMAVGESQAYETNLSEYTRYAVYDSENEIQELCDSLYPSAWIYTGWQTADETDNNYAVTVYFKPGEAMDNGSGIVNFCFLLGDVPDFVQQDTKLE